MEDDEKRSSFGPNDWLIDEMYRQYLSSPESVGESWREFFSDYRPPAGRLPRAEGAGAAALEPTTPSVTGPVAPTAPTVAAPTTTAVPPEAEALRGPAARIVENMEASRRVPTATTVRTVGATLMEENRGLLNHHLAASQRGKVSFTHLIAWAMVKALREMPGMRVAYREIDGVPHRLRPEHLNLGLAVDVQRRDGSRSLVVPNIKAADTLDFASFFAAYNDLLRKVSQGALSPDDFAGTTVSLTNPGMLGTLQSVPRLMEGQSCIIAAGSIGYPPEYQSADPRVVAQLGIGKVMVLTSTYDHRVIQGAESGAFLGRMGELLDGADDFYEEIFTGLEAPHKPFRLARDINPPAGADGARMIEKQAPVLSLINMYRVRGHLLAHLNPLGSSMPSHSELELARYGLTVWDLNREFFTGGLAGRDRRTLREILRVLEDAYCDTVGIEYMHIQDPEQKRWIQERVEGTSQETLSLGEKRRILERLNAAEAFERFLHTKYLGHKRFSLEGAESLIPVLDRLLQGCAKHGIPQVVMGMSHRGRLNVLANTIGKSYQKIFREFEGNLDPQSREGTGDVKYHLGAKGTFESEGGGTVAITLASNPSHLEAADPVVEGMARALQDIAGDTERRSVLAVLIHGESAFSGQGVVAETLNMSALPGYRTGGTVHLVLNNGIGFTTGPVDARSSIYATDVAKMVQAPIFHVNGDDPEACLRVIDLALEFQRAFAKDVVVELIGYRRHGHNEADEPAFTQPLMYAKIRDKRSIRKLYTETLVNRGDISLDEAEAALKDFSSRLQAAFDATRESAPPSSVPPPEPVPVVVPPPPPQVSRETLQRLLDGLTHAPEGFTVHPKLVRQFESRRRMLDEDAVDWGTAELLAFASLVAEQVPVRISGQDTRRGTFSQRHAVLVDFATGEDWVPLQHLQVDQAPFLIYDSPLSEYAVMGFEYGYSVSRPEALVLWEAQFGDFVNGAQIVVDQFLAAAQEKWGQRSKLVLLLPHGFEGQGPEHSSGRIERFLQLAASGSMRVAVPSTAGQHFHLLRSQGHLADGIPLVVFTPKSLLRAEPARSSAASLTTGAFLPLLEDPGGDEPERVVICSGKVAHALAEKRAEIGATRTLIARAEQLAPFPEAELRDLLHRHPGIREVCWVQEEPQNMGGWTHVAPVLAEIAGQRPVRYVGRAASGSPATGSARLHQIEQDRLVEDAFAAPVHA